MPTAQARQIEADSFPGMSETTSRPQLGVRITKDQTHLLADLDRVAAPSREENAVTGRNRARLHLASLKWGGPREGK